MDFPPGIGGLQKIYKDTKDVEKRLENLDEFLNDAGECGDKNCCEDRNDGDYYDKLDHSKAFFAFLYVCLAVFVDAKIRSYADAKRYVYVKGDHCTYDIVSIKIHVLTAFL